MSRTTPAPTWCRVWLAFLWCALLMAALPASAAQAPVAPTQAEPARPDTAKPAEAEPEKDKEEEKRITPEQAEELFRSIDQILEFVAAETGLPVHRPVKRQMSGREAVQQHVEERLEEDEDAQRLQRSEAVLKKFGLLPRDFDLRPFLISLMREQVAGFYNFRTGTVHLLDWVDPEAQLPLLAHELTHAVQDQNFPLEEWLRGPRATPGGTVNLEAEIVSDERIAARQAVIEGQAMVVLINFLLAPGGRSVLDAPQIVDAIKTAMMDSGNSPEFTRAPKFIQEALTFPYNRGLDFVLEVLRREGAQRAFRGLMTNPPRNTRHIMMPRTYLEGEEIPPLQVPSFAKLLPGHEHFDAGSIGQFDVALLAREYGAEADAERLASTWRGGYYYAAQKKEAEPGGELALVYASRWASESAAREFAGIYSAAVPQRYPGAAATSLQPLQNAAARQPPPMHWRTAEGDVIVEQQGAMVLVMEGLDAKDAVQVRRAILGAPGEEETQ